MRVRFNRYSWHRSLYDFASNKRRVPASLCPYFWSIVAAIVLSPFWGYCHFISWIGSRFTGERMSAEGIFFRSVVGAFFLFMTMFLTFGLSEWGRAMLHLGGGFGNSLLGWLAGWVVLGAIIWLFIGMIMLSIRRQKRIDEMRNRGERVPPSKMSLFAAFMRARKEKLCPTIEWEYNQETTGTHVQS